MSVNGVGVGIAKDTIDQHENGVWAGWIRYANIATGQVKGYPLYFTVNQKVDEITISKNAGEHDIQHKILNIKWVCQTNYPCNIGDYGVANNIEGFDQDMDKKVEELGIQNPKNCFIQSYLEEGDPAELICVLDMSQLDNIRSAIVNAYNHLIERADITEVKECEEGDLFMVNWYVPNKELREFMAEVRQSQLQEAETQEKIFGYEMIEPQYGTVCGLEFRKLDLPFELKDQGQLPQACFAFQMQSQQNIMCSVSLIRPVMKARMLMKKIHELCLKVNLENGNISDKQFQQNNVESPSDEGTLEGGGVNDEEEDPDFKHSVDEGFLEGNSIWVELGQKVSDSNGQKGMFLIKDSQISFKGDEAGTVKFSVVELFFTCATKEPCTVETFQRKIKKKMSSLKYEQQERAIANFYEKNRILKEESCTVLEFNDPLILYHTNYIFCLKAVTKGDEFRKVIESAYEQTMTKLKPEDGDFQFVSYVPTDLTFDCQIVLPDQGESSEMKIHFDDYKIFAGTQQDIVVLFKNIDTNEEKTKCKIYDEPKGLSKLSRINGLQDIVPECCFSYEHLQSERIICTKTKIRCQREKKMMLKKVIDRCQIRFSKEAKEKKQGQINQGIVTETFNFGEKREILLRLVQDGRGLPEGSTNDDFANDIINDQLNGKCKLWAYAATLTTRDDSLTIQMVYLDIDEFHITFKKEVEGDPIMQYQTNWIYWPCENEEDPCSAKEYLEHYSKLLHKTPKDELFETVKEFVGQTQQNDINLCMVVEFMQPKVGAIVSEFICGLSKDGFQLIGKSISNAFYKSYIITNLSDVPKIQLEEQVFPIKVSEEGAIVEDKIDFNLDGIQKHDSKRQLFHYKDIMPDKAADICAIWFRDLKVDPGMEMNDNNCCFTYIKNPDIPIVICSDKQYRCIRDTKIMLKGLYEGCKRAFKAFGPRSGAFPDPEPQSDFVEISKIHEDNGEFEGQLWVFEMMQDKHFPEAPLYVEINLELKELQVYDDDETEDKEPLQKYELLNLLFPCKDEQLTCDVPEFEATYIPTINSDEYKVSTFKTELKTIQTNMRNDKALDLCTIVQFKIEQGFQLLCLCSFNHDQNLKVRKIIAKAFDFVASNVIMQNEVSLASVVDKFSISLYNSEKQTEITAEIQLGSNAILDLDKNIKLMSYDTIESDKYGTPCAFWFKHLQLPPIIKQYNFNCCFAFSMNTVDHYICIRNKFHCIMDMKILVKSLRQGCLHAPLELSSEPSVCGDHDKKVKETELMGEPRNTQKWDLEELKLKDEAHSEAVKDGFPHATSDNFEYDEENGVWRGWMLVTPIPDGDDGFQEPRSEYIHVDATGLKQSSNDQSNPGNLGENSFTDMVMPCKAGACCTEEFAEMAKEGSHRPQFRFLEEEGKLKRSAIDRAIGAGSAQLGGTQSCTILQWIVNNANKSSMFCTIKAPPALIKQFNSNVVNLFQKVSNLAPSQAIPPALVGAVYNLEHFAPGSQNSEVLNMQIENNMIMDQSDMRSVIEYKSIDSCFICYHLVQAVVQLRSENECCIKFSTGSQEHNLCSTKPIAICQSPIKSIANRMYQSCKAATGSNTDPPLPCGTQEEYAEMRALLERPPPPAPGSNLTVQQLTLTTQITTTVDRIMEFIAKMMAYIQSLTSDRTQIISDGVRIINTDRSVTLQLTNGNTIITRTDGVVIFITVNQIITIRTETVIILVGEGGVITLSFVHLYQQIIIQGSGEMVYTRWMAATASAQAWLKIISFSASHVATFSSSYEMIIVMNFWSMMMEIRWMILYCMEKWASSALIMLRYQIGAAAMYKAGGPGWAEQLAAAMAAWRAAMNAGAAQDAAWAAAEAAGGAKAADEAQRRWIQESSADRGGGAEARRMSSSLAALISKQQGGGPKSAEVEECANTATVSSQEMQAVSRTTFSNVIRRNVKDTNVSLDSGLNIEPILKISQISKKKKCKNGMKPPGGNSGMQYQGDDKVWNEHVVDVLKSINIDDKCENKYDV